MGNTCSQCTKNKEGDSEFGGNLSCKCDLHGMHSPATQACKDFEPATKRTMRSNLSEDAKKLEDVFYGHRKKDGGIGTPYTLMFFATIGIILVIALPTVVSFTQVLFSAIQGFLIGTTTIAIGSATSLLLPLLFLIMIVWILNSIVKHLP